MVRRTGVWTVFPPVPPWSLRVLIFSSSERGPPLWFCFASCQPSSSLCCRSCRYCSSLFSIRWHFFVKISWLNIFLLAFDYPCRIVSGSLIMLLDTLGRQTYFLVKQETVAIWRQAATVVFVKNPQAINFRCHFRRNSTGSHRRSWFRGIFTYIPLLNVPPARTTPYQHPLRLICRFWRAAVRRIRLI